jgi:acrylyl-CoA reductase (NADPH)
MTIRALMVEKDDQGARARIATIDESALGVGDVTVSVEYSTVNYKDGLAITNASPIIKSFPLIPGIDLAGTVETSEHSSLKKGDRVVLNGWGLGVDHNGGFAQKARLPGDWLIKLPQNISTRQAAAIGTAGYTAMLSVIALEQGGIRPTDGDVLVTGASGGAGSVAIALLSKLGYRVLASTGRPEEADYLKSLGAAELIDRKTLSEPSRPIGMERWIGAIDAVGSHTLANVLAQTRYGGVVAAFGLAQGTDLPASMLPFILRYVTLAGIDSVNAPRERREIAWSRLATDLDLDLLETMVTEIGLNDVIPAARSIQQGKIRGRTVVNVNA